MTNEQIAHDLTLLLIDSDDKTPKKLVDVYFDTFPTVYEAVKTYQQEHRQQSKVRSKSETGLY